MTFAPSELAELVARIASSSSLFASGTEDEAVNGSISKLTARLNVEKDVSQVGVLDAALSLMCIPASQVYHSTAAFTINTIIELLEQVLMTVPSSDFDFRELVEACDKVIGAFEKRGGLVLEIRKVLHAGARLMLSSPKIVACGKSEALSSKLQSYFPNHILQQDDTHDIPLRLLWWYLDPMRLKKDVMTILQELTERPFLCLNKAFHEMADWRSIVMCLALSPVMFIEIRGLLHRWFLETGLDCVLELLSELVSVMLDIISRPTCWGLKAEIGLKLPFPTAYFPHNTQLLRIFNGPLSKDGLKGIVHRIEKQIALGNKHQHPSLTHTAKNYARIDEKSSWALALNVPEWFYFSCVLLFSRESFEPHSVSGCISGALGAKQASKDDCPSVSAAKFIAWILSPTNHYRQLELCEFLSKWSESLTFKQTDADRLHQDAPGSRKILKKQRQTDENTINSQLIISHLNKFQNMYLRFSQGKSLGGHDLQKNAIYRRIPLGILIAYCNHVSDDGYELLMHYAITGTVLPQETQTVGLVPKKHDAQPTKCIAGEMNSTETIQGANLAFKLTELAGKIFDCVLESEQSIDSFTNQVKLRVGKYLLKCIKRLLKLKFSNGSRSQIMDLLQRLVQWRHQGQESPLTTVEFDIIISELHNSLASLR